MHRLAAWIVLAGLCGGCGGGYRLSAADSLAPVGGQAPVVVRLQYRELPFFTPPANAEALRFRVAEGPLRAARTDKNGYASAIVPAPQAAGIYPMAVALQDIEGQEANWELRIFVWDPRRPIVAVDVAALVHRGRGAVEAQAALARVAQKANILYLTDEPITKFPKLHQALAAAGLPDGPILPWAAEGWWQQEGWWRTEEWWQWERWRWGWWRSKAILSPLAGLREVFPALQVGIAASPLAVQAFEQAEMKCLLVGSIRGVGEGVTSTSWGELAEKGLE
ncbi:MAG: hypothetical protein MUP47_08195 [Phycisphaerae bacterium]|nr:hypothetical protein [Phycisphaerae bacterium]